VPFVGGVAEIGETCRLARSRHGGDEVGAIVAVANDVSGQIHILDQIARRVIRIGSGLVIEGLDLTDTAIGAVSKTDLTAGCVGQFC